MPTVTQICRLSVCQVTFPRRILQGGALWNTTRPLRKASIVSCWPVSLGAGQPAFLGPTPVSFLPSTLICCGALCSWS